MLGIIIKFKKLAIILILGALLSLGIQIGYNMNDSHALLTEGQGTNPQIVVRIGEYGNEEEVKAGKRIYINDEIYEQVKTQIKVREDEKGMFISEFDVNRKVGTRIAQELSKKGIKVDLQVSTSKSQDLNASGRWARKKNPDIYFSVHHNAFKENSSGYLFIVNNKDKVSEKVAQQLSNAIVDNPMNIPQMRNRYNENNYIGEMNEMAKIDSINILAELGFFSNPNEVVKIVSDEQVEFLATTISNELVKTLNNLK